VFWPLLFADNGEVHLSFAISKFKNDKHEDANLLVIHKRDLALAKDWFHIKSFRFVMNVHEIFDSSLQ
jgi:hypothetical protein